MSESQSLAERIHASADQTLCDQFKTTRSMVRVEDEAQEVVTLDISKTWRLRAESSKERLVGGHHGNSFGSDGECSRAVRETCKRIEQGEVAVYVEKLERYVGDGLKTAIWSSSKDLGKHAKTWLHTYHCSRCNGQGKNRCSGCGGAGQCRCTACTGGKVTCGSCAGSGWSGTAPSRYACGACHGQGKLTCNQCSGSSQVRCGRCGGRGTESCDPCRATGYFTDRHSITVSGESTLDVRPESELSSWQHRYLQAGINGKVEWAPLRATCVLDESSVERANPAYPISFEVRGSETFSEANLAIESVRGRGLFVGEDCRVYQMGDVGDALLEVCTYSLFSDDDRSDLQLGLNNGVAQRLLSNRDKPGRVEQTVLRQASIVSYPAVNSFFETYQALLQRLQVRRSEHAVRAWLKNGVKFAAYFLAAVAFLDMIYGNQIVWEYAGLHAVATRPMVFLDSLWTYTSYFWFFGFFPTFGLPAIVILIVYLVIRRWLMPRRKKGKLRFLLGLLTTTLGLITAYWLLGPLVWVALSRLPALPGLAEIITGIVNSFLLLPEALLFGLLISVLRLRSSKDQALRSHVTAVGSEPLLQDLGYR